MLLDEAKDELPGAFRELMQRLLGWGWCRASIQRAGRRICWASAGATTRMRTLLIHGARAVIRHAERKRDAQGWLHQLIGRRNKNVAAVALANKNARIVWALLARERESR